MARCGRCGLWAEYPEDRTEREYAGACLWYQIRLPSEQVFEKRECSDFFEKLPGVHPMDQFEYKVKRDNLGDAYETAKSSKVRANVALVLSILGLIWSVLKVLM